MKRNLCLIFAFLTVISLFAGCGGSAEPTETTAPAAQTNVAKPFTKAELDAIPIANSSMSVEELRQICVDFMRCQNSIPWTPSKTFIYYNNENFNGYNPGKVLGGMPYITLASGSLYNFMHFYDERNGMLDIEAVENLLQPMNEIITNQCSGSTYWAWARVSNCVKYEYTSQMFPKYGCYPVGGYYIDPAIKEYSSSVDTRDVCTQNGEQKIYAAYTAIQPADGLVHYLGAAGGHVYMASSKATVVYKSDGTIDGDKSYITILDQTFSKHTSTQENGVKIDGFGSVDEKRTFKKLFETGYLPFTIPEFLGTDPVEKAEIGATNTKDTVRVNELYDIKVKSNYPISYTTLTVKDTEGEVLYSQHLYTCALNIYEFVPVDDGVMQFDILGELANGKNTVEITARIGTGEVLTAYTGKLVK